MNIYYKKNKLADLLHPDNYKSLVIEYSKPRAEKIAQRLQELTSADNLEIMLKIPASGFHALSGNRKGQFAVKVKDPYRIVFVPKHDPLPCRQDGGICLPKITDILIIDIEDYH